MIPIIFARPVTIRMGNNSKKNPEYKPSKKKSEDKGLVFAEELAKAVKKINE